MTGAAPPARRWRSTLAKVALALAAPLLLLGLLEAVFALFDLYPEQPLATATGAAPSDDDLSAFLEVASRRPAAQRVICLGDSTMAGVPFHGKRHSMCDLVAHALGEGTEVLNTALAGRDSGYVLRAGRIACRAKATLILAYTGHNEFLNKPRFRVRPPGALLSVSRFLRRFRVYRAIAALVSRPPSHVSEAVEAEVPEDEVYAELEANVRALFRACRGKPLIVATPVSNPAYRFPAPAASLRESLRQGPASAESPDGFCRHCLRAGPQVHEVLARLAAEHGVPLVDSGQLLGAEPETQFWDHVHPKPELHVAIAREMLALARARGFVASAGEPVQDIPQGELRAAEAEVALYNVQFDPERALAQLEALSSAPDPAEVAVAIAVAGFVLDRPDVVERGFSRAQRLLADDAGLSARWEACGRERLATGNPCMPWRSSFVLSPDEHEELTAAAARLGGAAVTNVIRSF